MKMTEEINQARAEYVEKAKCIILDHALILFRKWPRLKSISFVAYIPAYCDGDICSFRSYADSPLLNGYDKYEETEGEGENLYEATDEEAPNIIKEVRDFLDPIPDEVWHDIFGDSFRLTISAESFKIEEYDCGY